MLDKKEVINFINTLPDTFSVDEVIDGLILLDKIERGLEQLDKGNSISDKNLDQIIFSLNKHT